MQAFPSCLFTAVWTHTVCLFCFSWWKQQDPILPSKTTFQLSLAPTQTGMTTTLWNVAIIELVTPCQCFGSQHPGHVISLRNREALQPPPVNAAAQLIKTQTFDKTLHYHDRKTRNWKEKKKKEKKQNWGDRAHFPIQLSFFFPLLPLEQHISRRQSHSIFGACACVGVCVRLCLFSAAHGSCRLFSPRCILLQVSLFWRHCWFLFGEQTAHTCWRHTWLHTRTNTHAG